MFLQGSLWTSCFVLEIPQKSSGYKRWGGASRRGTVGGWRQKKELKGCVETEAQSPTPSTFLPAPIPTSLPNLSRCFLSAGLTDRLVLGTASCSWRGNWHTGDRQEVGSKEFPSGQDKEKSQMYLKARFIQVRDLSQSGLEGGSKRGKTQRLVIVGFLSTILRKKKALTSSLTFSYNAKTQPTKRPDL